jgi:peptide/nickel transport system substrate-binding protein
MKSKLSTLLNIILILVVASLSLASFTGCASKSTPANTTTAPTTTKPAPTSVTPKYGGTLKYGDPFFPASNIGWGPNPSWGGPTATIFLETLVKCDKNGVIQPNLATKWEVASDRKSIMLTLRQGVKFHDGSDWNATVAKWNLDVMIAAKKGDFAYASSVDILDNYTVRLNMNTFSNAFFTTLGGTFMVSKAAYDAHGGNKEAEAWMAINPVGTGPFKLDNFKPGVSIKGVKFDGYWQKGLPYLDAIEMYGIGDPMTRTSSFQAGEVDMIAGDLTKVEYDLQQKGGSVQSRLLPPNLTLAFWA